MASVGLAPALALVAGAACGIHLHLPLPVGLALLASCLVCASGLLWWHRGPLVLLAVAAGAGCAGAVLGAQARDRALDTPLRSLLDREIGGFAIGTVGAPAAHEPIPTRLRLTEDAARGDGFTSLRARVEALRIREVWEPAEGGVIVSVGGAISAAQADAWYRGRTVEAPVTFRRPARYLDEGVPDAERDLALSGTTLLASVKSGLLIAVVGEAGPVDRLAARVRRHIRLAVGQSVGRHSALSAAIVNAVLIGDRSGLPDADRLRLQSAGTYHVIAISGGNIAILAALSVGLLMLGGAASRPAAAATLVVLVAYAEVVTAGPSVWRATLMAAVYLCARLLDHRTAPWQTMSIAAMVVVSAAPLDVRDAGFLLTFGATCALLEAARRIGIPGGWPAPVRWCVGATAATLAVEVALMPVSALAFSRVTIAGLLLNLVAIPAMGLTQVAGMVVALPTGSAVIDAAAGWLAHLGAWALVGSARLVDLAPWLAMRVPEPPWWLVAFYYAALAVALAGRRLVRIGGAAAVGAAVIAIVTGATVRPVAASAPALTFTLFDVGQGDAMLLELPDGSSLMVDTGGAAFGGGGFDIGARVLEPALWARGLRRLDVLLVTHGDPDHIGGARSLLADLHPRELWEGIPVPRNIGLARLHDAARQARVPRHPLHAGELFAAGGVRVRVLNPEVPDWERPRVRNDDSVVLEVVYGDVAILLTGDISAEIERRILPRLTPAGTRILKVAHHGSRTSSSAAFLEGWRPQIALISCGRGNAFGHPAPDVLARLAAVGATVYRTDRDGEVMLWSDGTDVRVGTLVGRVR